MKIYEALGREKDQGRNKTETGETGLDRNLSSSIKTRQINVFFSSFKTTVLRFCCSSSIILASGDQRIDTHDDWIREWRSPNTTERENNRTRLPLQQKYK
jgi:hypothetical protein